jgi:FAD:protein FMN transferase
MKQVIDTIMNMPISVEIVDERAGVEEAIRNVFDHFRSVDAQFSVFKDTSEISAINAGRLAVSESSPEMQEIFHLSEKTKKETLGFFDIRRPDGVINPSGVVKGWAIHRAARILSNAGFANFYVEAGGDIQVNGHNAEGKEWSIGIRDPLHEPFSDVIKVVYLGDGEGIATSGTYIRGQHIYDPHMPKREFADIVSLTVIGPNVCDADRYATAAFAMGREGIGFIERLDGYEGYAVDSNGMAVATSGFESYTVPKS